VATPWVSHFDGEWPTRPIALSGVDMSLQRAGQVRNQVLTCAETGQ
jgi:hypothetical protein